MHQRINGRTSLASLIGGISRKSSCLLSRRWRSWIFRQQTKPSGGKPSPLYDHIPTPYLSSPPSPEIKHSTPVGSRVLSPCLPKEQEARAEMSQVEAEAIRNNEYVAVVTRHMPSPSMLKHYSSLYGNTTDSTGLSCSSSWTAVSPISSDHTPKRTASTFRDRSQTRVRQLNGECAPTMAGEQMEDGPKPIRRLQESLISKIAAGEVRKAVRCGSRRTSSTDDKR